MSYNLLNVPILELEIDCSLAGDNVIIPASGTPLNQIAVYKIFFVLGGDVDLTYKDGPAITLTGPIPMLAYGSHVLDFDLACPWFRISPNNDFIINLSAPVQVSGRVYYSQSVLM